VGSTKILKKREVSHFFTDFWFGKDESTLLVAAIFLIPSLNTLILIPFPPPPHHDIVTIGC
jgi:hypothetical protein